MNKSKPFSVIKTNPVMFFVFAFASFYFFTVDVFADGRVPFVIDSDAVLPIHIGYLIMQALGFFLFSVFAKFCQKYGCEKLFWICIYLGSIVSLLGIAFAENHILFILAVMTNLFLSGIVGSAVYCYAAIHLNGEAHMGLFCGFSIATASLLQIVYAISELPAPLCALFLGLALTAAVALILTKVLHASDQHEPAAGHIPGIPKRKSLILLLLIVAVISVMGGINDGTLTIMTSVHELELYSFPRLFYLVGVLIMGIIADVRNGKYMPISILAAMLCATVGILFMDSKTMLNVNACIYSLFAGFAIIYFTIPFWRIAAASENCALWAGMGRGVRLIFLTLGTVLMEYGLKSLPFYATIAVFSVLSAILTVLFWLNGSLTPISDISDNNDSAGGEKPDTENRMLEFCTHFNLTEREQAVFHAVLTTDSTGQDMADSLYISRRIFQRHIASIYEKTGTKTRAGLIQLYYTQTFPS